MARVSIIGLDADDTLWHNETFFRSAQERLCRLLAPHADAPRIQAQLAAVEQRNLGVYGYGVKGFTLSMLETALELASARASPAVLAEILALGREMMTHPVEHLPGVETALTALAERARLVLITKGDLFHQEAKLAASGLGDRFAGIEIVSDKHAATYARVFKRHGADPERALMAGNSLRSDILPALDAGCYAAWIPYPLTWAHEAGAAPDNHPRFRRLDALAQLPAWVDALLAA